MINFQDPNNWPFVAVSIFLIWNLILTVLFVKNRKKLKMLFGGKKAADLEEIIFEEIKKMKNTEADIAKLYKRTQSLKESVDCSLKNVGLIRFDPFKQKGGNQSFSIALLDTHANGLVISSLFTQDGNRVYGKPISKGQSQYPLTEEEKQALSQALKQHD